MGYRDDFYTAENLIGYTGSIHAMPSVYFQSSTEFGHITQFHTLPLNIGRGMVRNSDTYSIENEQTPNGKACVERHEGKVLHTSRNLFIEAPGLSHEQRAVLLQSITTTTDMKQISSLSGKERRGVMQQHRGKMLSHIKIRGS